MEMMFGLGDTYAAIEPTRTRISPMRQDDPYRRERESLVPFLTNMVRGSMGRQAPAFGGYLAGVGGRSTVGPRVDASPVWGEGQIQQRVNAGRALTDAQRDVNIRNQGRALANRGYTTGSPLAMHLAEQQRGLAMMGNARNENDLRWNAALENARHVMQGQTTNAQLHRQMMDEDIRRRQMAVGAWQADSARQASEGDRFMDALTQLLAATRPQWVPGGAEQELNQSTIGRRRVYGT